MRFTNEGPSRVAGRSGLYLVPNRRGQRVAHLPVGRALHLVDLENLAGGSDASAELVEETVAAYRAAASVGPVDLVIVASGTRLALDAGLAWPGARLVVGRGLDGADRALLAEMADSVWVATHFDRVVLGSGDGIFSDALASIRARGVATGLVIRAGHFSWKLQQHAAFVRALPTPASARRSA